MPAASDRPLLPPSPLGPRFAGPPAPSRGAPRHGGREAGRFSPSRRSRIREPLVSAGRIAGINFHRGNRAVTAQPHTMTSPHWQAAHDATGNDHEVKLDAGRGPRHRDRGGCPTRIIPNTGLQHEPAITKDYTILHFADPLVVTGPVTRGGSDVKILCKNVV